MAEPKAYEPEKLTSGVTWKWKKTVSDYPASEWTLTYYLRKDGATATSFSAAADGDTHLVTVAAATTAGYAAGVYDIIGVVVKAAEKYVVFDGIFEVLTNPATAGAYDPRTHARRVLDLIEAAMEGRIPNGMESYSIVNHGIVMHLYDTSRTNTAARAKIAIEPIYKHDQGTTWPPPIYPSFGSETTPTASKSLTDVTADRSYYFPPDVHHHCAFFAQTTEPVTHSA